MSAVRTTAIEWTDTTWNPVRGCDKVSPGCAHCYAETFAERFRGVPGHPYEQGFDLRLVPHKLDEPLKWKEPRRVFVNSMSDLFQDGVPDEYIADVFGVMAVCGARDADGSDDGTFGGKYSPERLWYDKKGPHTFQVLTKRPKRMHQLLTSPRFRQAVADAAYRHAHNQRDAGYLAHQIGAREEYSRCYKPGGMWPLTNVWLGVSVENQHFADERIPLLLQTPAAVRFISAEPLLEAVDLSCIQIPNSGRGEEYDPVVTMNVLSRPPEFGPRLDWVIVGGESGPGARLFRVEWARAIIAQCAAAGVACFMKQLGSNPISQLGLGGMMRHPKGGDPPEWPEDLRVRQFPPLHSTGPAPAESHQTPE